MAGPVVKPVGFLLGLCADWGRSLLVAGLIAGILLQNLASVLKPYIPELVVVMLFLAVFRVGPRAAVGVKKELQNSVVLSLVLQLVMPLMLIAVFSIFNWQGGLFVAAILVAAGSPISGAPNLVILVRSDPAPALRLLIIGTALLPFSVIPVFWLTPELGEGLDVFYPALKLLAVIGFAGMIGFGLRHYLLPELSAAQTKAVDGASALAMMVIVIGLMAAVGPAISITPQLVLTVLAAAFLINFGLQIFSYLAFKKFQSVNSLVSFAIIAGNRNIALFLTALPDRVTEPLLLFIGCYQIPMYVTPILLARLYRSVAANSKGAGG